MQLFFNILIQLCWSMCWYLLIFHLYVNYCNKPVITENRSYRYMLVNEILYQDFLGASKWDLRSLYWNKSQFFLWNTQVLAHRLHFVDPLNVPWLQTLRFPQELLKIAAWQHWVEGGIKNMDLVLIFLKHSPLQRSVTELVRIGFTCILFL